MLGKKYDYDGSFGYQCFDLGRWRLKKLWKTQFKSTWNLWAQILWVYPEKYSDLPFVKNTISSIPKKWDIVIWAKTKSNIYGHIAILKTGNKSKIIVLEQNGWTWLGSWQWSDAIRLKDYNYTNILWRFSI